MATLFPLPVFLHPDYKPECPNHRGEGLIMSDLPSVGNVLWPVGGSLL